MNRKTNFIFICDKNFMAAIDTFFFRQRFRSRGLRSTHYLVALIICLVLNVILLTLLLRNLSFFQSDDDKVRNLPSTKSIRLPADAGVLSEKTSHHISWPVTDELQQAETVVLSETTPKAHSSTTAPQQIVLESFVIGRHDNIRQLHATSSSSEFEISQLHESVWSGNLKAINALRMLLSAKIFNINNNVQEPLIKFVVLIQVHNRVAYLSNLLNSLLEARDINRTLVICSHDFRSSEIDKLIFSLAGSWPGSYDGQALLVQIFYPFSPQSYPKSFPGPSLNDTDCRPREPVRDATARRCQVYDHPDTYQHYRSYDIVQTKHHWWWKLNFINFILRRRQQQQQSRNFSSPPIPVVFLEEDHYVVPDIFYTLEQYSKHIVLKNSTTTIITLGNYLTNTWPKLPFSPNSTSTYRDLFGKSLHGADQVWTLFNMGFVLNPNTINFILNAEKVFCSQLDDYNWDWTLEFYFSSLLASVVKIPMLGPSASRVFHLGSCGLHHKAANCTESATLNNIQQQIRTFLPTLFPPKFDMPGDNTGGGAVLRTISRPTRTTARVNGGWSDPRDHLLCRKIYAAFAELLQQQQTTSPSNDNNDAAAADTIVSNADTVFRKLSDIPVN